MATSDRQDGETLCRVVRIDRTVATCVSPESTTYSLSLLDSVDVAVGDWVWVDDRSRLRRRVARTNTVSRARADGTAQVLAANVDIAFLVVSAESAHRPGLLERLASTGWETGADPHFIVTKCDRVDREARLELDSLIAAAAPGILVSFVSALNDEGREDLQSLFEANETAVLIGHSGVGKSTLLNWLTADHAAAVGEVRARDAKGRHTTTARSLRVLPNGHGAIIDTPGLRELGVSSTESLARVFEDAWDLVEECRFADCRHVHDAGCAVTEAVRVGGLDAGRYRRFLGYLREAAYNERRGVDPGAARRVKRTEYSRLAREYRQVRGH